MEEEEKERRENKEGGGEALPPRRPKWKIVCERSTEREREEREGVC